jgi:hypothetical protein
VAELIVVTLATFLIVPLTLFIDLVGLAVRSLGSALGKETSDLEPEAGIEPATPRLRIVCSAKLSYSGALLMILA